MTYGQYLRLETMAGGVGCTDKQFIAACHSVLKNKFSRDERDDRHRFIRNGLEYLNKSRGQYLKARF